MAKLDLELDREVGSRSWIAKLDLKLDCEVGSRSWIAKLGREVGSEVGSRSWIFLAPLDVTFEDGFPYSPVFDTPAAVSAPLGLVRREWLSAFG